MADEAGRRRELRRRRILENAEERKRKIFGASVTANDATPNNQVQKADEPGLSAPHNGLAPDTQSEEELDSSPTFNVSTSTINNDLNNDTSNSSIRRECINVIQSSPANSSRIQNGSVPDLTEQLINLNRLMTANGGISPNTVHSSIIQEDVQPVAYVETLNSSVVLVALALFVCSMLYFNLGYIVSNSISVPFILWEAQHLWCHRNAIQASSRGGAGLLGIALMLCGVQQTTITIYAHLITIVKCFFEDFALYILTVVLWCTMIGLPGLVQSDSLGFFS